jgi:endonuclease G, mitochondrial
MLVKPRSSFALVAILVAAGCDPAAYEPAHETNPNVRFGMPAPARTDPESRDAYLIARPQYVLSYNGTRHIPNWVAWRLRKEDIGGTPRLAFEPDPALPMGVIARVTTDDYAGFGFDRGHMCPAKDRSATVADSEAVFYMTNIVPQSPACNEKAWERLEDYSRRLVNDGHVLYIACGPVGVGGTGKAGSYQQIGKARKIMVPAALWKVILVLPSADAEPRKDSRVIAVVMPNDQSVDMDWAKYRTSVDRIEKTTGLAFFNDLPGDVAQALREQVDDVKIKVAGNSHHNGGH